MSNFHNVVIFNDYYTLIIAFLTKQMQNRNRNRRFPNTRFRDVYNKYVLLEYLLDTGFELKFGRKVKQRRNVDLYLTEY